MISLIPSVGRLLLVEKAQKYLRLLKFHAYKHPDSICNFHMYIRDGIHLCACIHTHRILKQLGILTYNILPFYVSAVILA